MTAPEHLLERRVRDLTRERDELTVQRDSARDIALVLEEANEAALQLHVARDYGLKLCAGCALPHPCSTRRALTGADR